ncbi:hypothetical protein GYMLUDRAFT_65230 [Collybiopsis luxurians FD-317 M1]|uniref:Unplaced genomic scaffold GYMLUscaffold_150, whole genome shotgun sequence n=1 Tax=Collybiopsis luxurians FD-317 M1 TaxID=944289 RepID=A0A0D0C739_9AGAR|nr:hypothetical protein GYMLUDRAFT_65230 [Collybiopsis luxurians FD-317 M1]
MEKSNSCASETYFSSPVSTSQPPYPHFHPLSSRNGHPSHTPNVQILPPQVGSGWQGPLYILNTENYPPPISNAHLGSNRAAYSTSSQPSGPHHVNTTLLQPTQDSALKPCPFHLTWANTVLCDNVDVAALSDPPLPPAPVTPSSSNNLTVSQPHTTCPSYVPEQSMSSLAMLQGQPTTAQSGSQWQASASESSDSSPHSPSVVPTHLPPAMPQFGPVLSTLVDPSPPSSSPQLQSPLPPQSQSPPPPQSQSPPSPQSPPQQSISNTINHETTVGDSSPRHNDEMAASQTNSKEGSSGTSKGRDGQEGSTSGSNTGLTERHGTSDCRDDNEWEDVDDHDSSSHINNTQPTQRAESGVRLTVYRVKQKALVKAIEGLKAKQDEDFTKLAEEHGITVSKVKRLFGSAPHLNKRCTNSVQDAILHAQAQLMNAGKGHGQKASITQIWKAAKKNKELQAAKKDKDKLAQLMQDLVHYQQDKKEVAKISNKTGALHAGKLFRCFKDEVSH